MQYERLVHWTTSSIWIHVLFRPRDSFSFFSFDKNALLYYFYGVTLFFNSLRMMTASGKKVKLLLLSKQKNVDFD